MHGLPFTPSLMTLIPATIITGFLGSGKTTLLKRLLTEAHGQKIAVIENEFGEEPIDNDILVSDTAEQIIQMNNGCVCCTIREDLRSTLTDLAEKRRSGTLHFDRVVIETTGLADPGQQPQELFEPVESAQSGAMPEQADLPEQAELPELAAQPEQVEVSELADQFFDATAVPPHDSPSAPEEVSAAAQPFEPAPSAAPERRLFLS